MTRTVPIRVASKWKISIAICSATLSLSISVYVLLGGWNLPPDSRSSDIPSAQGLIRFLRPFQHPASRLSSKKLRINCWVLTGESNHATKAVHVRDSSGLSNAPDGPVFVSTVAEAALPSIAGKSPWGGPSPPNVGQNRKLFVQGYRESDDTPYKMSFPMNRGAMKAPLAPPSWLHRAWSKRLTSGFCMGTKDGTSRITPSH